MAKPLVSDELWAVVEPLLPPRAAHPQGGHPFTVPDRAALTGIIFVLQTGIPWEYLPQEMGCGSGVTCWRRLRDWHAAGAWKKIHRVLLEEFHHAGEIDWSRAVIDSSSLRAVKGGPRRDPIRPIGRGPAANTTSSRTPRARRWWQRSLVRMLTTLPSSFPSSTKSPSSADAAGGRASAPRGSRAIARTPRRRTRRP